MRNVFLAVVLLVAAGLSVSCDEGVNDDNSSARVTGYVYRSPQDMTGVRGVQIILEAAENSETPYTGPDRWTETDENGHYDAYVFLGKNIEDNQYVYLGDFLVQYFYQGARIDSVQGVTLSPGSVFTMPPRYVNQ